MSSFELSQNYCVIKMEDHPQVVPAESDESYFENGGAEK